MSHASSPPPTGEPVHAGWHQLMTYQPQVPAPTNPTRRPILRGIFLWSVVVVVFGLAALAMTFVVTTAVGPRAALLALVSSAIALGIVIPLFLWVDRLEAEPPRLLWFAFLWGALISTLGALLLNDPADLARAEILREKRSPQALARLLRQRLPGWLAAAPDMPQLLHDHLRQAVSGEARMTLRSEDLRRLAEVSHAGQRQTVFAILGSGLLIVAAVLYVLDPGAMSGNVEGTTRMLGMPLPAWIAGLGALWAFAAAWPRSR